MDLRYEAMDLRYEARDLRYEARDLRLKQRDCFPGHGNSQNLCPFEYLRV